MNTAEMEKRFDNGIEYRYTKKIEIRASEKKEDENSYIVEGYASTFDEEYNMGECDNFRCLEKVDKNAFSDCDMSDVIMQYDHQGRVYARTSNGTLTLSVDDHGLKVRADLHGTAEGRNLYDEIKGGYTNKMSFGFTITADSEEKRNGADGKTEYVYTIKKVGRLFDVSAVSIPANDFTVISARKRFNAEAEKRMAEANEAENLEKQKQEEEQRKAQEKALAEEKAKWLWLQKNKE